MSANAGGPRPIDIHTHAFPERIAAAAIQKLQGKSHTRPFTDGTVRALGTSMDASGVGLSVLQPVATNPEQVPHVNDAAIRMNDRAAETGMHPDFEGWRAELGRVAASGLRGIKLHPVYQGVDIDDPRYLRVLSRAGELGLVVLIHAGWDVGFPGAGQALPGKILNAIRAVGSVTLILAHMGGWRCWDEAEKLLSGTGAYIDTAFSLGSMTPNDDGYYNDAAELALMDAERFVRMVRAFGRDRVLFGTDSPWVGQAEALRDLWALPLTEAEKASILHDNAARLLGL